MKSIIIIMCLILSVSADQLIGIDCAKNDTNMMLVSCERTEILDFTLECPVFIDNECDESMPCKCRARIFERPCTSIYRCVYENKTISTTLKPDTSTKSPSDQTMSETTKIIIGVSVVVVVLSVAVCICCFRWNRVCLNLITNSDHRLYAVFHSNNDNAIIHCDSNA